MHCNGPLPQVSISYLGTKTSSSSDSLAAIAHFFPPTALTGEGIGGGVISILWKADIVRKTRRQSEGNLQFLLLQLDTLTWGRLPSDKGDKGTILVLFLMVAVLDSA